MTNNFPFDSVLIANRGEIVRRVMHTCREWGLRTIAVYAEPDRDAPFVREADETISLEGTSAAETYLDVKKVLNAAERSGAQAVHPGYGFLSENATFAKAVQDAEMTWIGPSIDSIKQMGSKARALAQNANVPLVPGMSEDGHNDAELLNEAKKIGFPVLIKASAGGGGKGMRVVEAESEFIDALQATRREAKSAFGDDHMILEKYIKDPRHIEIQVFGDTHGNVVHLFERECSIQRRHQKIVEESPSIALDTDTREAIATSAVHLAQAVDYEGAGTVEFMLDADNNFYFLEMNTRLQVEHPVTELITGLDLVALQLQVAAGDPLPFQQSDLAQQGHAIEVRLYAEDPSFQFAPQTGTVSVLNIPQAPGIRWDGGIETGSEVSPYFDPMLGKLIAFGPNRDSAIRRLRLALEETVVLGVNTNLNFLQDVISHPAFESGDTTTSFIDEKMPDWSESELILDDWLAMVAYEVWGRSKAASLESTNGKPNFDPWALTERWRNV
jgi:acetyl-CoA carboxylase biotin carboxylase subunit